MPIKLKLKSLEWFTDRVGKKILRQLLKNKYFPRIVNFYLIEITSIDKAIELYNSQNRNFFKYIDYE